LVLQALTRLTQRHPQYQVSALLLGSHQRGVIGYPDGRYEVTQQFVTKLFRHYTHSEIKRYHYRYYGRAWGGYRYARLAPPLTTLAMPKRTLRTPPAQPPAPRTGCPEAGE
jgi:hypothetical protein